MLILLPGSRVRLESSLISPPIMECLLADEGPNLGTIEPFKRFIDNY
jgi:hypothetical protein